jgi:predicted permease
MPMLARFSSFWRNLFHKSRVEEDLAEEVRTYLELLTEEKLGAGMSPEQARREALLELGGVEQVKEQVREVRIGTLVETLWQDLRYGARQLRRSPAFTTAAVVTLALGIGANTAIFSVVNAVLLRPLPYKDPERLVMVWEQLLKIGLNQFGAPLANYFEYRDQNQVFEDIAAVEYTHLDLTGQDRPERLLTLRASANLFPLLGVKTALGRAFVSGENQPGHGDVAILSDALWRSRFGADPGAIGRTLLLDGKLFTVIGVMPRGLRFTTGDPVVPDVWIPLAFQADPQRDSGHLTLIARLKPGVSVEHARSHMQAIASRLEQQYHLYRGPRGEDAGYDVTVIPLRQNLVGEMRRGLLLMLGAVGLVLLIACVNVANLVLARAATRQREILIRAALGASRARLIRQVLTEGILLALMGGGLSLLLARYGVRALVAWSPYEVTRVFDVPMDARVFVFAMVVSVFTGIIFGLMPALQGMSVHLAESLKGGAARMTSPASPSRTRQALVVMEVALSFSLVVGAGLLIRSFARLRSVSPGFNPERVLTAQISLPPSAYPKDPQVAAFYSRLLERLKSLPGVKSASLCSVLPFTGTVRDPFSIEGRPWQPEGANGTPQVTNYQVISPDYFRTMQIPLLRGREFRAFDGAEAPPVAIVNQTMARGFWPDGDPIGRHIMLGAPRPGAPWLTIVGIVEDVRNSGLDSTPLPQIYTSQFQTPSRTTAIVMRTSLDPDSIVASVRHELLALDRDRPLYSVVSMQELVSDSIAPRRYYMLLLGGFAALALVLAAIGIYGVISYSVAQRTHEIGIRMALGAQRGDVLRRVVGHGLALTLIGVGVGLAGAFAMTRFLSSLLYDMRPTDPLTFAVVTLGLLGVAAMASYIPARRATRVDPMVALRYE